LKLRLEDQGEGWFWEERSIEVDVLEEVRQHSRQFYTVVFRKPLETCEGGEQAGPGGRSVVCTGAWLSPRWVGHEIVRNDDITALLWLIRDVKQAAKPPRDVDYSARVKCREVD
jgi:hypothetical protein